MSARLEGRLPLYNRHPHAELLQVFGRDGEEVTIDKLKSSRDPTQPIVGETRSHDESQKSFFKVRRWS